MGNVIKDIGGGISRALQGAGDAITGANQTRDAIKAQTSAADKANATQRYIFDQQRADNAPWRDAGVKALSQLSDADFSKDFTINDFQQDPGYLFRMQEGQKALERSAAARGGLNSGATLKALSRYGQDYASNEFTNAYNRFNADRDRRFNRLSSLSGIGQTAQGQINNAGMNYGNNVSSNQIGVGNAAAAAYIGQANRNASLIGQGAQLGMTALMASDIRLKTDIEEISKTDLDDMKKELKAYKFKYKSKDDGVGEYIGVMAQDLEKSKLGKTLVFTDENGFKKLDMARIMSLFLATLAEG